MATAYEQLQEQIEAVRQEAEAAGYERGYAAAVTEMTRFLAGKGISAASGSAGGAANVGSAGVTIRTANGTYLRRPRGQNRNMVFMVVDMIGRPVGATEIQKRLANDDVAYSSIRHALKQLTEQGKLTELPGGLWEVKKETASPSGEAE